MASSACALTTLWGTLGVDGGWHELQWPYPRREALPEAARARVVRSFVECADRAGFLDLLGCFAETETEFARECTLSVAPRCAKDRSWPCMDPAALWARVEGKRSAALLARFRPGPTLVLQEGSTARYVALWASDRPIPWEAAERGNRRIAYALRTVQKFGAPMEARIHPPGTALREGRSRAVPIVVAHHHPDALYKPAEIAAHLRVPPPPKDWRNGR